MMTELYEIFGSASLPQVRGIAQFEITACADAQGDKVCRRVLSRRQFEVSGPPCPDQVQKMVGSGEMGSLVHLSPVEIARQVEGFRVRPEALEELLRTRSAHWESLDEEARRAAEEARDEASWSGAEGGLE